MRRTLLFAIVLTLSLPLFATEPNPTARQRVLVEKLLDVTNVSRASLQMMDSFLAQMQKQFLAGAEAKGNRPQDIAEAKELFEAVREKAAKLDFGGLMQEAYIGIYSKYFTEKELEELLVFYGSPVGKKSTEVMSDLAREGMEAAARELSPKIDQMMAEVLAEQEKKRPWRRTMSDIRNVATALEAYALDHDDLYPNGDYASLKALLSPAYMKTFPEKDIWGHPYAYVVSPDRKHYRFASAGSDGIFDWDSRRIVVMKNDDGEPEPAPTRYRDRLEDDIIYGDYGFLQLPVQAKAEEED